MSESPLITKYDGLGRTILTGIWNNGNVAIARDAPQTLVNAQSSVNLKETRTATGNGYTNVPGRPRRSSPL